MIEKKLTNRAKQAIKTKQQILDTSLELIAKEGYDNVSINAICKKVGVSVGAFYHHFSAKEDIIVESYKQVDTYFEECVQEQLNLLVKARDKIIAFVSFQVEYAVKMGVDLVSQVYKAQIYSGTQFFISQERALPRTLHDIILYGQEKGEIRKDISAFEITKQILRLSRGLIYDWCIHNGKYDLIAESKDSMNYFIQSFLI